MTTRHINYWGKVEHFVFGLCARKYPLQRVCVVVTVSCRFKMESIKIISGLGYDFSAISIMSCCCRQNKLGTRNGSTTLIHHNTCNLRWFGNNQNKIVHDRKGMKGHSLLMLHWRAYISFKIQHLGRPFRANQALSFPLRGMKTDHALSVFYLNNQIETNHKIECLINNCKILKLRLVGAVFAHYICH